MGDAARKKRAAGRMGDCPETRRKHVPADLSVRLGGQTYRCHWCSAEVTLDG